MSQLVASFRLDPLCQPALQRDIINIVRNSAVQEVPMTKENVEAVLNKVRPSLQADGGDVELVDVADGTVKVRLTGACGGCPMSTLTLKMGIERILKKELPEVKEVVAVAE
jgi:Fe-S cluster biogenesis protein NfuA